MLRSSPRGGKAHSQRDAYYTGLPAFDPLRADTRFTALLGKLSLPVKEAN